MTKFSLGSVTRKAVCLVCVLSFLQFSVSAQESAAASSENQAELVNPAQSGTSDSTQDNLPQNWNWNSQEYTQNQGTQSTFVLFMKMVLSLAVVLGLVYLAVRFLKRGAKISSSDDPFLRHVSHLPLSPNRSVDVVTIMNHAYILGVSDNAVNLIGQIEDEELVNSMNLYADKNDNIKRPRSFDDILSIFMPGGSAKNQNIYGSTARNAAENLERQRNRLNGDE